MTTTRPHYQQPGVIWTAHMITAGYDAKQATTLYYALATAIENALADGKSVRIPNMGTYYPSVYRRETRPPPAGGPIPTTKHHLRIRFRVCKAVAAIVKRFRY